MKIKKLFCALLSVVMCAVLPLSSAVCNAEELPSIKLQASQKNEAYLLGDIVDLNFDVVSVNKDDKFLVEIYNDTEIIAGKQVDAKDGKALYKWDTSSLPDGQYRIETYAQYKNGAILIDTKHEVAYINLVIEIVIPEEPEEPIEVPDVDISKFVDVDKSKWYINGIQYVNNYGIMTGYSDGTNRFGTNDPITRAQFATMIHRMAGLPEAGYTGRFPDVPNGKYYTNAVEWCASKGIVTGNTKTGMFMTSSNISRQDLAVMLFRYAADKGDDTSSRKELTSFTDGASVSSYATDALSWCVASGIITGKDNKNGTFSLDPKGEATRAECATMIMRYMTNK